MENPVSKAIGCVYSAIYAFAALDAAACLAQWLTVGSTVRSRSFFWGITFISTLTILWFLGRAIYWAAGFIARKIALLFTKDGPRIFRRSPPP